jgi:hypothetical protein
MKATTNLEKWIWVKFFQTQPWFVGKKIMRGKHIKQGSKDQKKSYNTIIINNVHYWWL